MNVTLNPEQRVYVIPGDGGHSCLGFDNARDHAANIAAVRNRPELALTADEYQTIAGYYKYRAAVQAWCDSPSATSTYFDPHTLPDVQSRLENFRRSGTCVRIMLGNTETGESWLEEHDVIGTVGRSMGPMRVPILLPRGQRAGGHILTACILMLQNWETGRRLFTHPNYKPADLAVRGLEVLHKGTVQARFITSKQAHAYVAFQLGAKIEPKEWGGE